MLSGFRHDGKKREARGVSCRERKRTRKKKLGILRLHFTSKIFTETKQNRNTFTMIIKITTIKIKDTFKVLKLYCS